MSALMFAWAGVPARTWIFPSSAKIFATISTRNLAQHPPARKSREVFLERWYGASNGDSGGGSGGEERAMTLAGKPHCRDSRRRRGSRGIHVAVLASLYLVLRVGAAELNRATQIKAGF